MPHHHDYTPPEQWQAALRSQGHRLTPQREFVLRAVERLGHATPDEILVEVRKESSAVNVSTVYRTLELLEDLGLVRHAHLTERSPTYHSAASPAHVHLVCRSCGRVIEATDDVVQAFTTALLDRQGFTTDVGHLTVFGTCADCPGS